MRSRLAGNLAHDPDAEPRSGEGLAVDCLLRQAEFKAQFAHLVFEEFAQRFNEIKFHDLRQAADVMVRLDRCLTAETHRFDDVRIQGALGEILDLADLVRLFLENLDKAQADTLAFDLRVLDPRQFPEKIVGGIDIDHLQFTLFLEKSENRLGSHRCASDRY